MDHWSQILFESPLVFHNGKGMDVPGVRVASLPPLGSGMPRGGLKWTRW